MPPEYKHSRAGGWKHPRSYSSHIDADRQLSMNRPPTTPQRSNETNALPPCRWAYLGRVDYQEAWDIQHALVQARADERIPDRMLLLEHPPTYTLGRRDKPSNMLLPRKALEALGARVIEVDRGGEITFHGPGQLVGYPIIGLRNWGGPLKYVRALEATLIAVLDTFGIQAGRIEGLTGVWAYDAKIAAIGVRVSRGVTSHGFALNVGTDLGWFQHIVPCGIPDRDVTSMERLLGKTLELEDVATVAAEAFGREMGFRMTQVTPEDVTGIPMTTPSL